jgi:hypothetical protein
VQKIVQYTLKKNQLLGEPLQDFSADSAPIFQLGINAKWIDTHTNMIVDDISRLKASSNTTAFNPT